MEGGIRKTKARRHGSVALLKIRKLQEKQKFANSQKPFVILVREIAQNRPGTAFNCASEWHSKPEAIKALQAAFED